MASADDLADLKVPTTFELSKNALLSAWEQLESLTDCTSQCKILIEHCQDFLFAIVSNLLPVDNDPSTSNTLKEALQSACFSVRDVTVYISKRPFIWQLFHQDDITLSLLVSRAQLEDLFDMNAHIDPKNRKAELLAFMEKATAQDEKELSKQLERLSRFEHKTRAVLEKSQMRSEELYVALTKSMMDPPTPLIGKFIKHAVGVLKRDNPEKKFPDQIDIAPWEVTSLEVTFNRDEASSKIGSGSFGNVVAVKEMYTDDARGWDRKFMQAVKDEIKIWSRLIHPRILPFYGACLEAERPFIISRFCAYGNIIEYLSETTDSQVNRLDFVRQISSGMRYLHSQCVIHADLKGANILVADDNKVLIADFGLSEMKRRASMSTRSQTGTAVMKGTLHWMSPELLQNKKIDYPADVYSFGITVWELYTLEVPFSGVAESTFVHSVIYNKERPIFPPTMSDALKGLVNKCWSHDADKRPNFKTISAQLEILEFNVSGIVKLDEDPKRSEDNGRAQFIASGTSKIDQDRSLIKSPNIPHEIPLPASVATTHLLPLSPNNSSVESIKAVEQLLPEDVIIAVMGPTGSGKSSFISTITGIVGGAGHNLESCTTQVSTVRIQLPELGTGGVVFVDTPGFDDTNKTDVEILKMISEWMVTTYKREIVLNGILYLHRISDNRMAGTPLKNLRMFEKMCGKDAYQNIVLTTTMWDDVDRTRGEKRQKQLEEEFWKSMMDRGSKTARYFNTRESALRVIRPFFDDEDRRQAMQLQRELVDIGMQLRQTSAGRTLYGMIEELVQKREEILQKIRVESKKPNNRAAVNDLMAELTELTSKLEKTVSDAEMDNLKLTLGDRLTLILSLLKKRFGFVKQRGKS